MLACAVLFFPWVRPRETVCGLMGRWLLSGTGWQKAVGRAAAPVLDALFHRYVETCDEIAVMEAQARKDLYPDD